MSDLKVLKLLRWISAEEGGRCATQWGWQNCCLFYSKHSTLLLLLKKRSITTEIPYTHSDVYVVLFAVWKEYSLVVAKSDLSPYKKKYIDAALKNREQDMLVDSRGQKSEVIYNCSTSVVLCCWCFTHRMD